MTKEGYLVFTAHNGLNGLDKAKKLVPDIIILDIIMPDIDGWTVYQKINQEDIVIICDVGAYGMVLSSNYNLRAKPAEILISKNSAKIITRRQKLNNII